MQNKAWTTEQMGEQRGRVALVTGANSGIGFETARALAAKGATVIVACRDRVKGEQAVAAIHRKHPSATVELMLLDLAALAAVRAFADQFLHRFDRLDLLINNAGVMMPPLSRTADGFELQFGTNHLGHFALTGLLLKPLLKTPGSRVVTVASMAHRLGSLEFDDLQWQSRRYDKKRSYGQSKLANLLFTAELQRRLAAAGSGTLAVAAHPGWTHTDLQRHVRLFELLNPFMAMPPWQGALPTLYAATAPEVVPGGYYGPKGWFEVRGYPGPASSSAAARDEDAARRLWRISEELTGVHHALPAATG